VPAITCDGRELCYSELCAVIFAGNELWHGELCNGELCYGELCAGACAVVNYALWIAAESHNLDRCQFPLFIFLVHTSPSMCRGELCHCELWRSELWIVTAVNCAVMNYARIIVLGELCWRWICYGDMCRGELCRQLLVTAVNCATMNCARWLVPAMNC
jgi:hypothetical protein